MTFIQDFDQSMDKKQIRKIFLFIFKQGQKTTESVNDVFDPRTANKRTKQLWFQKFRGRDESLKDDVQSSLLLCEGAVSP